MYDTTRKGGENMAWLSDATLEKRCRRKLAKYGYQLHKSRKQGGGYTVTGGPYPDEPDGLYEDIYKLIAAVEQMEERFATLNEK